MDIKPIRTNRDYRAALKQVSALVEADPAPGTPDGDRLDILATLVHAYEQRHFPMDLPDPVEAIKSRPVSGILPLRGSGRGLWGPPPAQAVANLRDEWGDDA